MSFRWFFEDFSQVVLQQKPEIVEMPCGPRKVIQAQMSLMTTGGIRWSDLPSRCNHYADITTLDVRQLAQASIDNDGNYALLLLRVQRRERLSSVAKGRTGPPKLVELTHPPHFGLHKERPYLTGLTAHTTRTQRLHYFIRLDLSERDRKSVV